MTPNEYQKLAMRTCSVLPSLHHRDEYIANHVKRCMTEHAVFGLCSESGEVAGIYQKQFQGHDIDEEHVKKELGDCLWMIAELCTAYDWNLEEIMKLNIQKLKERYPDGFDPERSLHRANGDI